VSLHYPKWEPDPSQDDYNKKGEKVREGWRCAECRKVTKLDTRGGNVLPYNRH
jgi:hypothetical protein